MPATFHFAPSDLEDDLPQSGLYIASITSARFRKSSQGNRMLQVLFKLEDVPKRHERITDFFVMEGTSENGIATARRRLVQLCRACALNPQPGDEIPTAELVEAKLQVKVVHDQFQGEPRLRIVAYRRLDADEEVPF
jgi:hypothetical protein